MARVRVLLVVSSLAAGGAERVVSELANTWVVEGWKVGVLTLSSLPDHYQLDKRVVRISLDISWNSKSLWERLISNLRRCRSIRAAIRSFSPDVVLSFVDQTNIRVLLSLVGSGIPIIASERTDPRRHRVGKEWELARFLLYRLAARVVVQTYSVAEWAHRIVPRNKVEIIPNFVRSLPKAPEFHQRSTKEILAVGRLCWEKGFDLLLQAFAKSELAQRGVRLTILGEGPDRSSLEAMAKKLGIEASVSMPGVVQAPEEWMARCAVFVLPSRYEGFPNVLLEAMAMGCPVIATDCQSGPREIIRDKIDGLLVPPENVDALAQAITLLMEDRNLRWQMSKHAREVRDRFGKKKVLKKWELLIENFIENNAV